MFALIVAIVIAAAICVGLGIRGLRAVFGLLMALIAISLLAVSVVLLASNFAWLRHAAAGARPGDIAGRTVQIAVVCGVVLGGKAVIRRLTRKLRKHPSHRGTE